MELYASMRFTLVCMSAAKFPTVIESSAAIHTSGCQALPMGPNAVRKIRKNTANAAAGGPAERNPATGVGAPWYTSGAQIWKGAAETLNPSPTNISAAARVMNTTGGASDPVSDARIAVRFTVSTVP